MPWGLSPRRSGHDGVAASWGSRGENLCLFSQLCCSPPAADLGRAERRRRSGDWQVDGKPHLHGIESLRLEKTSKIIKSNHQPITPMPAKPCPEVPHLHIS